MKSLFPIRLGSLLDCSACRIKSQSFLSEVSISDITPIIVLDNDALSFLMSQSFLSEVSISDTEDEYTAMYKLLTDHVSILFK